ncbi:OLC1v1015140C1 [Oldenlandia corymbosa var. corymbosa]|uniref:OLC1v1015140C1 n=1 Tax=Oldenlandia corymbosa var. corymbosa TaxID=529605 RepID=A0AAV1E4S0_OLDCO|nr:OLC1v1015140C1 [Oldenlandia corymbosa var. corymbosa]
MDTNSGQPEPSSSRRTLRLEDMSPMEIKKRQEAAALVRKELASKGIPPDAGEIDHAKFTKGTTALAFVFKEGLMVAVDHSSTSSELLPQNVVALNSHMLATISGGSEYLLNDLQKKKPGLYRVDGEGAQLKRPFSTTGSGTGFAFGSLCALYRPDLTETEAVFVAKRALCLSSYQAPERRECVGGRDGWSTKVSDDDVVEVYTQFVAASPVLSKLPLRMVHKVLVWKKWVAYSLSCQVAEDDGKSKGFGLVQSDSEDSAVAAALNDDQMIECNQAFSSLQNK